MFIVFSGAKVDSASQRYTPKSSKSSQVAGGTDKH